MPNQLEDDEHTIPYEGEDWQDTSLEPMIGSIHAYSTVFVIPVVLFWMFFLFFLTVAVLGISVFALFARKGLHPIPALKAIRSYIIGDFRPALPANRRAYWR